MPNTTFGRQQPAGDRDDALPGMAGLGQPDPARALCDRQQPAAHARPPRRRSRVERRRGQGQPGRVVRARRKPRLFRCLVEDRLSSSPLGSKLPECPTLSVTLCEKKVPHSGEWGEEGHWDGNLISSRYLSLKDIRSFSVGNRTAQLSYLSRQIVYS